jgi:hypothetical protein
MQAPTKKVERTHIIIINLQHPPWRSPQGSAVVEVSSKQHHHYQYQRMTQHQF